MTNQKTVFHSQSQTAEGRATKKAATFWPLSACPQRRLPSLVSRRGSVRIRNRSVFGHGGQRLWSLNLGLRSLTHMARSATLSTRMSKAAQTHVNAPQDVTKFPSSPRNSGRPIGPPPPPTYPASAPSPVVTTLARPTPSKSRHPSVTARARRAPSSSKYPPLRIDTSTSEYVLDVALPVVIKPEMVTVSTAKGAKLRIVADAWHLEKDCHFEWEIVFATGDVDITSIRAKFGEEGHLVVRAGRRARKV
ncbi:hypothetical protein R3P38DRAFT_316863 [Favolaschia claudopus]|uniref:SHSP domain-containing protein n=1 Tax=Favolaschia claudopus TaxID=2862362 RepID=A0AAW0CVX7_9AGAR